jgi:hypothetical protein
MTGVVAFFRKFFSRAKTSGLIGRLLAAVPELRARPCFMKARTRNSIRVPALNAAEPQRLKPLGENRFLRRD